ncbi:MAG: mandelate racemase/muconate lactonizing enzyme family protein [Candidatus Azotimanducaceae bacterium]|uniref:Mandelate racemase/muconate lactonizing enzyme family protein n=1 Tax=OM182 bacterium TaxID=2510334 RepID=A0A520S3A3_9GAMM|nr:hypothetical protein [Gammaproteobacteria bacterium]RZO76931.1 MAG: mandelate racemase/muconate lactonizing enzyme family protein [OM182 bacterium]
MKITRVRAVKPLSPGAPDDWRDWLGQILIMIDTEEGLTGYGVGGGGLAGVHVIDTVIRDILVGQDSADVESLWEEMYWRTLPYGQKGLAIMAISGADLALWDLRAKVAQKPLAKLLSKDFTQTVPAYRTGRPTKEWLNNGTEGYSMLKLFLGFEPGERSVTKESIDRVIHEVRAVRAVLGPDVTIMGDAFMGLDVDSTLRLADELSDVGLSWIEEPLLPDDLEGYARLRDECPIPIAGGEHEYTAKAFDLLMRERLHTIVQPDVCWCGGMTELLKIYRLGAEYGIDVCPHRGSEIWSLHAICALDPNPLAESGRPWMTWVKDQPSVKNGQITLGEADGFGVAFDSDSFAVTSKT